MKKIMILSIIFLLASCLNNDPGDPGPTLISTDLKIRVENTAGENLLDPATECNILGNEIYIAYQGERLGEKYENRYGIDDRFSGGFRLVIGQSDDNIPVLIFTIAWSSRDDDLSLEKTLFTIYWGDGTSDEIEVEINDEDGKLADIVWLNGELEAVDELSVTIVK
jgi:hypothetical protein